MERALSLWLGRSGESGLVRVTVRRAGDVGRLHVTFIPAKAKTAFTTSQGHGPPNKEEKK